MNEMRAASMLLAAYLVSSADSQFMVKKFSSRLDQRIVQPAHLAERLGRFAADDDAVGLQAVLDGGAFLEEFGIGDDLHVGLGLLLEEVVELAVGAGGDGGLDDDGHHVIVVVLGQGVADFLAGPFQVAHVDGAVRLGRRADARKTTSASFTAAFTLSVNCSWPEA